MRAQSPKGTRDFDFTELSRRNYVIDRIKAAFEIFSYRPLETPSFENIETLMGKYGDEGDRLIFKILRSGDFLRSARDKSNPIIKEIADKALRYDLTVPFSRYVSQNNGKLTFPFKRYQIQPVWRADKPQKGRFREFLQCDADVVGSKSLWQEVEMLDLYIHTFKSLNLPIRIKLNNRKILAAISEVCGIENRLVEFTIILDKIDKIGEGGVLKELKEKGFSKDQIEKLKPAFNLRSNNKDIISYLNGWLGNNEQGISGTEEVNFILNKVKNNDLIDIDICLARGLNYYTGSIFEVNVPDVDIGSVGGGGRYDDLTSLFGLSDVSGVGISFGLDRIMFCLQELGLMPNNLQKGIDVMILRTNEESSEKSFQIAQDLREAGVLVDFYPDLAKMKKQFDYAEKIGATHVLIYDEANNKEVIVKDIKVGKQVAIPRGKELSYFLDLKK
jgi:histidyl-tRNA synthetase